MITNTVYHGIPATNVHTYQTYTEDTVTIAGSSSVSATPATAETVTTTIGNGWYYTIPEVTTTVDIPTFTTTVPWVPLVDPRILQLEQQMAAMAERLEALEKEKEELKLKLKEQAPIDIGLKRVLDL